MRYQNFQMSVTGPNIGNLPQLSPVAGHPYVWAWSGKDPYGNFKILTECKFCGSQETRDCEFPDKAPVWVARYCALHSHGMQNVREQFEQAYHMGLQAFNMRHRGW